MFVFNMVDDVFNHRGILGSGINWFGDGESSVVIYDREDVSMAVSRGWGYGTHCVTNESCTWTGGLWSCWIELGT